MEREILTIEEFVRKFKELYQKVRTKQNLEDTIKYTHMINILYKLNVIVGDIINLPEEDAISVIKNRMKQLGRSSIETSTITLVLGEDLNTTSNININSDRYDKKEEREVEDVSKEEIEREIKKVSEEVEFNPISVGDVVKILEEERRQLKEIFSNKNYEVELIKKDKKFNVEVRGERIIITIPINWTIKIHESLHSDIENYLKERNIDLERLISATLVVDNRNKMNTFNNDEDNLYIDSDNDNIGVVSDELERDISTDDVDIGISDGVQKEEVKNKSRRGRKGSIGYDAKYYIELGLSDELNNVINKLRSVLKESSIEIDITPEEHKRRRVREIVIDENKLNLLIDTGLFNFMIYSAIPRFGNKNSLYANLKSILSKYLEHNNIKLDNKIDLLEHSFQYAIFVLSIYYLAHKELPICKPLMKDIMKYVEKAISELKELLSLS